MKPGSPDRSAWECGITKHPVELPTGHLAASNKLIKLRELPRDLLGSPHQLRVGLNIRMLFDMVAEECHG